MISGKLLSKRGRFKLYVEKGIRAGSTIYLVILWKALGRRETDNRAYRTYCKSGRKNAHPRFLEKPLCPIQSFQFLDGVINYHKNLYMR